MLKDIMGCLVCPNCGAGMTETPKALRCARGHAFDVAKQGYVSMLRPGSMTGTADSTPMVEARQLFFEGGGFERIMLETARLTAAAASGAHGDCVVDVGAGIGAYLARVLDELPGMAGIALDVSKPALKRAARAHERIGAVACDVWQPLPVRSASAVAVLDVFAPRNPVEFHRVLGQGGALVVVTPSPEHLAQLVEPLGLVGVDERKEERLEVALGELFDLESRTTVEERMLLTRPEAETVIGMGPSARHAEAGAVSEFLMGLEEPIEVTASVAVSAYRPYPATGC